MDTVHAYKVAADIEDQIVVFGTYYILGGNEPLKLARAGAKRLSTKNPDTIYYVEALDLKGATVGAEGYANGRRDTQEGVGF